MNNQRHTTMKRQMPLGPFLNCVTTQIGNPEEDLSGKKPKDTLPKRKGDVLGKGLMYVDIKVNGKAIRAMVDTGATHNCIYSTKVERLGLTLEKGCGRVKTINSATQPVAGIARSLLIKGDNRVAINIEKKINKALTKDSVAQQLLKLVESSKTRQFWQEEGKSAFEIVNGQQLLLPHTVNVPNTGKSPRAVSFSEEWWQNIDLAHSYLEKAARKRKKHANKTKRSQEFNAGDKVIIKLLPQDRKFLKERDSHLLQKYEGPLTIVKKIGKMAYKVTPPQWWSRQLHLVFHVSMLKPFYEDALDPSRGEIKRPRPKP
ncbi:hypothetical protein RJ640_013802 [Escallonia rubra]|uniref:Tf2-1-like SH3-like domain-containing protein n=1 Tax=Escallonia rubra TaxID=112253 RepID=A0AA88TZ67_9ASTE|nr:hypothetical protein RJ640_013802 [Escallonia rubra]